MTSELKPCPFCGGPAGVIEPTRGSGAYVGCHLCQGSVFACPDNVAKSVDAAIAAWNTRAAQPTGLTEGFVLVPVEPTEAMMVAGAKTLEGSTTSYITDEAANAYRAMLAAIPVPPAATVDEAVRVYVGPIDDPGIGWCGFGASHPDLFKCERCGQEHLDCGSIPHDTDCSAARLLAALTPASPWISVKDRLPDEHHVYFAALAGGRVLPLYWSGSHWTGGITRDCKQPTHWQERPLPPPPESHKEQ